MDLLESYERQLKNRAEELQNGLATILKDDYDIKDEQYDGFEFGLTGAVSTTTHLRKQLSVENAILYDLWERFLRFRKALELIKQSLRGHGDMRASAYKKLESLWITVTNICQAIKETYLKPAGLDIQEQSFDGLEHRLMKKTLRYLNADKENSRDGVDSGSQQTLAADLRNYVIVSELNSMCTIFQLGISKLLRHRS